MRAIILDTNALVGLSPDTAEKLRLAELAAGHRQYADPWTLMELVASAGSADSTRRFRALAALQRCTRRALAPLTEPPRVVMSGEAQYAQLIFGATPTDLTGSAAQLTHIARVLGQAEHDFDQADVDDTVAIVRAHVAEKEMSFADAFKSIRAQLASAANGLSKSARNKQIRAFTQSDELARIDAQALVHRTFQHWGRPAPDPIPDNLLARVLEVSRTGSYAAALVLERILCDDADLDDEGKRNLLWDQEIAANVGKAIDGVPILIVSTDRFFAAAAKRAGHPGSVLTLPQHLATLGVEPR